MKIFNKYNALALSLYSSSHRRCSAKKGVLKNFVIFAENELCWSLFLIRPKACDFIEERLQHRCFPVKIAK